MKKKKRKKKNVHANEKDTPNNEKEKHETLTDNVFDLCGKMRGKFFESSVRNIPLKEFDKITR